MRTLALLLPSLLACNSTSPFGESPLLVRGALPAASPGVADPAFLVVAPDWKERLEQPYVYRELLGDYRRIGAVLQELVAEVRALGLRSDGAPFALYFDDPGPARRADLRARVCWPVQERPARKGSLEYDILPRAMVVYARVPGEHARVVRSYPALFSYLDELGWQQGGPIREIYLGCVEGAEPLTEVQVPWAPRER